MNERKKCGAWPHIITGVMNMKETNIETIQKIRMCIKTFVNLYGRMPSVQDMIAWLGNAYENAVPEYMNNTAVAV